MEYNHKSILLTSPSRAFGSVQRYIQGPGELNQVFEYGKKYGDRFLFLVDSGVFDMIPITTDERTARAIQKSEVIEDASIVLEGHIVSRGNNLRSQTPLEYPMAVEIEDVCFNLGKWVEPKNDVEIKGYVCENPICRVTPNGQEICELTIAVPKDAKRDGAQNYIKCITWNGTARFASRLYIGAFVEGLGRFQSRVYTKRLDGGRTVQRYAYEVSLYVMADGRI